MIVENADITLPWRADCHFFRTDKKQRCQCMALSNFYNAENHDDYCGECPFFKTDEEFKTAWNRAKRLNARM